MTTMTPMPGPTPPGPTPIPDAPVRRLRRSREDRVAAGLCGGLGRYFRVDPVIFRVLVAVLVLFGGSGIVIYLIGWLAVPDEDAPNAPIDRVVNGLRRRSWPITVLAAAALLVVWLAVFSWWAPFSIFPAVIVVGGLFLLLRQRRSVAPQQDPAALEFTEESAVPIDPAAAQLRSWYEDNKARSRERRRRSGPVRWTTLGLVVAAMAGLAMADVVHGIPFGTYFWVLGGITLAGLIVGLVTRRTPWLVGILLIPALVGVTTFGTSPASAHDGAGERMWTANTPDDLRSNYRLGFGRGTLDLSSATAVTTARTVRIVLGAGQIRLVLPRTLPVRIDAQIHQGEVQIDGQHRDDGWNVDTTYASPSVASAAAVLTIHVELTAGQLAVEYR